MWKLFRRENHPQLSWNDVSKEDLRVLSFISVSGDLAKRYFELYKRFDKASQDHNRVFNFLVLFDVERSFISEQLFEAAFRPGHRCSVSFVQFVYTCWYICNLSLEELYQTAFTAFDISNSGAVLLDDLNTICRDVYGSQWKKVDAAKKIYSEFFMAATNNCLRVEYATFREILANHTSFVHCIFDVHRRVRAVVFGEKYWKRRMGDLGISDECIERSWNRNSLMTLVKYNTPNQIVKSLHETGGALITNVNDIDEYLDADGNVIPLKTREAKANFINGVDRTAWVFSSNPSRNKPKTLSDANEKINHINGRDGDHDNNNATKIEEFADIEDHMEAVDLHEGVAEGPVPRQRKKVHDEDVYPPSERPRAQRVVDRLASRRLAKQGKTPHECHQFSSAVEMADYDEAQEQRLAAEGMQEGAVRPKLRATFSRLDDFDDLPLAYRHTYDECTKRPSFERASRRGVKFPGGVPVARGMETVQRVKGVPVSQLLREINYPYEEASHCSVESLLLEAKRREALRRKAAFIARRPNAKNTFKSLSEYLQPEGDLRAEESAGQEELSSPQTEQVHLRRTEETLRRHLKQKAERKLRLVSRDEPRPRHLSLKKPLAGTHSSDRAAEKQPRLKLRKNDKKSSAKKIVNSS